MPTPPKLLTYNGTTKTIAEWAAEYRVPLGTLRSRLNLGWTVERALATPVDHRFSSSNAGAVPLGSPRPAPKMRRRKDGLAFIRWRYLGNRIVRSEPLNGQHDHGFRFWLAESLRRFKAFDRTNTAWPIPTERIIAPFATIHWQSRKGRPAALGSVPQQRATDEKRLALPAKGCDRIERSSRHASHSLQTCTS